MQLLIGKKPGDEELKCFLALSLTGTEFTVGAADKKYASCGPQLAVAPEAELLFSANAVCRFVAANAGQLQSDDLAVDEWLEWEANTLAPWLRVAKAASNKNGELAAQLAAMLEAKEEARPKNSGDLEFLFGSELSLADVVAGVTLRAALKLIKEQKDEASVLQTFRKYVAQLFVREDVAKGVASMKNAGKAAKKGKGGAPAASGAPVEAVKNVVRSTFKLDDKLAQGLTYHNVLGVVESIFDAAIKAAYPGVDVPVEVARTTAKNAQFGDYQCNSAMSIFTALKGTPDAARSPRDVANTIIAAMPETPVLDRLTVAGAGFINAFLTKEFVAKRLGNVLANGVKPAPQEKQTIVVDFSSPNIAKDMHVGHLRSTIIGDTMCRILEFQDHDVKRINHVGDWGTQFGMLICHLTEAYPTWETEMPNVKDLTLLYKAAKERFDVDEEFHERSKAQVVLLQSGDEKSRKVWNTLCEISRIEFQKVYDRLGVSLKEMGESFYNPIIPSVLDMLRAKGLMEMSNGAEVIFTKTHKQPFMLVKSDGSYLYDTTDIAALWYRLHEMKANRIIYYTDYSQKDHFNLLFEVGRMSGIYDPTKQRADHVGFGTVNDESGKRFKTRSGEVVRLVELLDEAKVRMKAQLVERIEAGQTSLPMDQVDAAAEKLGYGAVKYFDLRQSPTSNYIFSFDRMLSTSGDTAVYLMFAYARLSSIIRKSGVDMAALLAQQQKEGNVLKPEHPTEQALVIELLQLQDVIVFINKDLSSNRLCNYLYTISEKVQTFVTACRVLGSEEQSSRLLLCDATLKVMKTCFSLLGIDPLDQI
ncbi:Arginine--tRNA ligase/mitochondrial [Phytophthora fragariae]|uniref:arginine--tRNA ligase n=3 Tax=Phytophthora fragariae TaxID=53985 RepID=A0A6A3JSC3_9STRA|nr:Arginine--tRNA ligase/mitochondrial [Phytophthora fragariae]KAE8932456.1 Arginine--tRNA ligase/mitochondrial [Phytophthora fragariae]KAE8998286.1 Arginine--tRNA ligase/mitochondrial [Phytophthora fragariae]KAE9096030.1 Arginine--tRNA ligase/mitochondrial [Phytophthora fragariae]KAE9096607.1 Arginine--tRNA ligase/mitochondrial [Phytophthora fragariae]